MTKRPPFVVLKVQDLYDANGVMQGLPSYSNAIVAESDVLRTVDGAVVAEPRDLKMLQGGNDTLVELGFSRARTGEEYVVRVRRHALHSYSRSTHIAPGENPPSTPAGVAEPIDASKTVATLQARVVQLLKENLELEEKFQELTESGRIRSAVIEEKQRSADAEQQAALLSLRRDLIAKDCTIADLTTNLTSETYRSRKAEGQLSKALKAAQVAEKERQDMCDQLASVQKGSQAMHEDLDRLENENLSLVEQLQRASAMSALEEEHRELPAKHLQVKILEQVEADSDIMQRDLEACRSHLERINILEEDLAEARGETADEREKSKRAQKAVEELGTQLSILLEKLTEQEEAVAKEKNRAERAERKSSALEEDAVHSHEQLLEIEQKFADLSREQADDEKIHAQRVLEMATRLTEAESAEEEARAAMHTARGERDSAKAQILVMQQMLTQKRDLLRQNDIERQDILEQVCLLPVKTREQLRASIKHLVESNIKCRGMGCTDGIASSASSGRASLETKLGATGSFERDSEQDGLFKIFVQLLI